MSYQHSKRYPFEGKNSGHHRNNKQGWYNHRERDKLRMDNLLPAINSSFSCFFKRQIMTKIEIIQRRLPCELFS